MLIIQILFNFIVRIRKKTNPIFFAMLTFQKSLANTKKTIRSSKGSILTQSIYFLFSGMSIHKIKKVLQISSRILIWKTS